MVGIRARSGEAAELPADDRYARAGNPAVPPREAAGRSAQTDPPRKPSSTTATALSNTARRSRTTHPAFHVAENEAIRTRRRHFSEAEQQRVSRAQSMLLVASDTTATPQERARAYSLARRELDGLMVLPERTLAQIERGISGELEGGGANATE